MGMPSRLFTNWVGQEIIPAAVGNYLNQFALHNDGFAQVRDEILFVKNISRPGYRALRTHVCNR